MSKYSDEAVTYVVTHISKMGTPSQTFRITKNVMDVPQETYDVTIKGNEEKDVWCTCMGFVRQTYDKRQHKHVRLIMDWQLRGSPPATEHRYHMIGSGKDVKIKFKAIEATKHGRT